RLMAPVLSFTAEEVWQALHRHPDGEALERTVHVEEFPKALTLPADADLIGRWDRLFEVREDALKALEIARGAGTIGTGLEAEVILEAPADLRDLLQRHASELATIFIVSRVVLGKAPDGAHESARFPGLRIGVRRAQGTKCERCWMITTDVGGDPELPGLCARCVRTVRALLDSRAAAEPGR
ncbi:MAG TPA: class I tRNA ligase family protein, partial [Candidatus Polarisedimenticolia bacterium]|nr:class I tRNA ligase family protein [Candidatus Polarisedimenticolia bacterium]